MKKLLFAAVLTLITVGLMAQTPMAGNPATVTNAASTFVQKEITGACRSVSVQFVLTKTSGTIAGKATVQGSLDGTNYTNIDSLTLTDVTTNTLITELSTCPYRFYKVLVVGSGTMGGVLNGYIKASSFGGNSTVQAIKSVYSNALDTVTNTGTKNLTAAKVTLHYRTVSIGITVTKVSGTLAGTITLQGSIDGVNYATIPTAYIETPASQTPYTTGGAATFTVPNYTAPTKIFTIIGSPYVYYRASYTGSGTMVGTIKGNILVQPQ
jgi:hypothetical protein